MDWSNFEETGGVSMSILSLSIEWRYGSTKGSFARGFEFAKCQFETTTPKVLRRIAVENK